MFQLRDVWASKLLSSEEFSPDAFCSFTLEDRLVIATGSLTGVLRFYFPAIAGDTNPATEITLKDPILQMKYGKFIVIEDSLAVLHPNQLILYKLTLTEGTIVLNEVQPFRFSHHAYNFIAAKLENQALVDQLIVQTLDGFLLILTESAVTPYNVPNFFLPCPFIYITSIESFIFATPDYRVVCYRKLQLLGGQVDDQVEEWSYVIGEQVVDIHYWRSSSKLVEKSQIEIAVIGDRKLVVLTEGGQVKDISYHSGGAITSHSYYSLSSRSRHSHNLIITTASQHTDIYVNFRKVWQLLLPKVGIAVQIVTIPPHDGLLSFMYIDGSISVGYLGTSDPKGIDLPALPIVTQEQLQQRIKSISDRLSAMPAAEHLDLFVNVSKSSPSHVEVVLRPATVQLYNVTCYVATPPSVESVAPFSVPTLDAGEVVFHIDLRATQAPPAERTVSVTALFSTSDQKQLAKSVEFDLPCEFYIKRVEGRVKGKEKVILEAHNGFAPLSELFPNFSLPDSHSAAFVLTNGAVVSISVDSKGKRYRVESDSYAVLGFAIDILGSKLKKLTNAYLSSKDKVSLRPLMDIAKQHYLLRSQERVVKRLLHSQMLELESIQKALIVRYEATTPEPLDDLNELFNKATDSLKESTEKISEFQTQIRVCAARVAAAVFSFIHIIVHIYNLDEKVSGYLKRYIPMYVVDCSPGWEEGTVAGVSALIQRMTGSKAFVVPAPEFLSNFDVLEQAFEAVVQCLSKKSKG